MSERRASLIACFNSRTREGCDGSRLLQERRRVVSIHAPGRGATCRATHECRRRSVSIHAPGRGATGNENMSKTASTTEFQFTHPGGVRPTRSIIRHQTDRVSIHAPGRGATYPAQDHGTASWVSIHAPGRGATDLRNALYRSFFVSIHAPGRGATRQGRV